MSVPVVSDVTICFPLEYQDNVINYSSPAEFCLFLFFFHAVTQIIQGWLCLAFARTSKHLGNSVLFLKKIIIHWEDRLNMMSTFIIYATWTPIIWNDWTFAHRLGWRPMVFHLWSKKSSLHKTSSASEEDLQFSRKKIFFKLCVTFFSSKLFILSMFCSKLFIKANHDGCQPKNTL